MLNVEHGHALQKHLAFQSPRYRPVNCAGGGGYFYLLRPKAVLISGAREGKAKTFNFLMIVLNLCNLAEPKEDLVAAAKMPMKTTNVCIFLINKSYNYSDMRCDS
jgi:hypothetical protein